MQIEHAKMVVVRASTNTSGRRAFDISRTRQERLFGTGQNKIKKDTKLLYYTRKRRLSIYWSSKIRSEPAFMKFTMWANGLYAPRIFYPNCFALFPLNLTLCLRMSSHFIVTSHIRNGFSWMSNSFSNIEWKM